MVATPNVVTPIAGPRPGDRRAPDRRAPDDQATVVIPVVPPAATPPAAGPSLVRPLLTVMIPTLLLALVIGAVAGRQLAPLLGAAVGVSGAALALWLAVRRADRT